MASAWVIRFIINLPPESDHVPVAHLVSELSWYSRRLWVRVLLKGFCFCLLLLQPFTLSPAEMFKILSCQPKEPTIFSPLIALISHYLSRTVRCISCCGYYSGPTGFSKGTLALAGRSVYQLAAYSTQNTRALTGANLTPGGQQKWEKYTFYNDPPHVLIWKFTYINTKYSYDVLL